MYLFTSAWDAATGEVDPESVPRARGQRGADLTRRAPLRAEPTWGQPHTQPPSSHSSGPGRSRHSGRGSLVSPQYLQIPHSQIHLLAKNSFASPRSTLSALLWPFVWTCAATCPTHVSGRGRTRRHSALRAHLLWRRPEDGWQGARWHRAEPQGQHLLVGQPRSLDASEPRFLFRKIKKIESAWASCARLGAWRLRERAAAPLAESRILEAQERRPSSRRLLPSGPLSRCPEVSGVWG